MCDLAEHCVVSASFVVISVVVIVDLLLPAFVVESNVQCLLVLGEVILRQHALGCLKHGASIRVDDLEQRGVKTKLASAFLDQGNVLLRS